MNRGVPGPGPASTGSLPPLRVVDSEAGAKELRTIADRRRKVDLLRKMGIDPFGRRFPSRTSMKKVREDHAEAGGDSDGSAAPASYRVAGRLVGCRRHRRAAFLDLRDQSGEIESICLVEHLGDDAFDLLSHVDVGDVLGVEGTLVTTRRGEPALRAVEVTVLGKSLVLPPQAAEDRDVRGYSRPEAALMASEEAQRILNMRIELMSLIRSSFDQQEFLEVETPILLPLASGAAARPFVTDGNALASSLYLRIATEQHLKRWVIGGFDRVFEVARCFRNEGMSQRHHFEFTMLEWMEGYADYHAAMKLIEELANRSALELTGSSRIQRRGENIDLRPPWRRMTVREAVGQTIDMDILDADRGRLARLLDDSSAVDVPWPELVGNVYSKLVEPRLLQPTFVTGFPKELFPLAKKLPNDAYAAEAFEAVVGGIEIATGVTSINDADEQRVRFAEQRARQEQRQAERIEGGLDEDFLQALAFGMMPATCAGVGVDRLLMLITGTRGLRDVIPFPTLSGQQ